MTEPFFPFRLYSSHDHGSSPNGFFKTFTENKPKTIEVTESFGTFLSKRTEDFTWFCFDVIIHSQTEVEFVCFDMESNFYGCKGREFHRFTATVDKGVTKDCISRRLYSRAVERRENELAELESKIYQSYAFDEQFELGIKFKS